HLPPRHRAAHRNDDGARPSRREEGTRLWDPVRTAWAVDRERSIVGPASEHADEPREPPSPSARARPTYDRKAEHRQRARLNVPVARQAHENDRGAAALPREQGPLLAMEEGEHPRTPLGPVE